MDPVLGAGPCWGSVEEVGVLGRRWKCLCTGRGWLPVTWMCLLPVTTSCTVPRRLSASRRSNQDCVYAVLELDYEVRSQYLKYSRNYSNYDEQRNGKVRLTVMLTQVGWYGVDTIQTFDSKSTRCPSSRI